MRWADFLIHILQAHGRSLQQLAAFMGEEELIELLEKMGEDSKVQLRPSGLKLEWFEHVGNPSQGFSPYGALEEAVRELNLSAVLDFYVWAYPYYRSLIEMPVDLRDQIRLDYPPDRVEIIVNEALQSSIQWIQALPIPARYRTQTERLAQAPWIRFRAEMLKKFGRRTMMQIG